MDSFPLIPSAYHHQDGIPLHNTVGTPEERAESVRIWYAMKSDDIFPMETVYAKTRPEQLRPGSIPLNHLPYSINQRLRQNPTDLSSWLNDSNLMSISGVSKNKLYSELIRDIIRFPLNPLVDPFRIARLLLLRQPQAIREYMQEIGATSVAEANWDYYPMYYLFFLLTRLASYPFDERQLELIKIRADGDVRTKTIVDVIFDTDLPISTIGDNRINHPDWVEEYVRDVPRLEWDLRYRLTPEILYSWTDAEVDQFLSENDLEPPFKTEHISRFSWIEAIVNVFNRR